MMIAVFIETREGRIKKSSLEAVSEAQRRASELGTTVAAVLVGPGLQGLASDLTPYGVLKIHCLENPSLADYSSQGFARALAGFVRDAEPAALFFAATAMGKDLAPRVAAALGVGMASDCTRIGVRDGGLEFTRPIYAGKALLSFTLASKPPIATLRPNVFPLAAARSGGTAEVAVKIADIPDGFLKGRVAEVQKEKSAAIDVAEAEVVISGGRGLKGPENFAL